MIALLGLLAGLCSIQALFKADTPSDVQWARLTIVVKNDQSQSVEKPRAAFDFRVPAGKIPVAESWNTGSLTQRLEKVSETDWRLWIDMPGSLAAGESWNQGIGAILGVHLSDWSSWEPWKAPSWNANIGQLVPNPAIRVWNGEGLLVWGPEEEVNAPPVSAGGSSSYTIDVGDGGTCNRTGTVVLSAGDVLQLRCTSAYGMEPAQAWLDGQVRSALLASSLSADGLDHQIQVRFAARPSRWSQVSVSGAGSCDPAPSLRTLLGEVSYVACAAEAGGQVAEWSVDGAPVTAKLRHPLDGNSAHSMAVRFAPAPFLPGLEVQAYRDLAADKKFSAYRIAVRNGSSTTLEAGWVVEVPVRIPDHRNMGIYSWDVPGASISMTNLGEGWRLLTVRSLSPLAAGSTSGEGRGWYFALGLRDESGAQETFETWDRTGDVALPATASWSKASYMRVRSVDGTPLAGAEWLMTSRRVGRRAVEVTAKDEGTSREILRPRIVVTNTGEVPLSDFVYDFHFCTEGGKQPFLEAWYDNVPSIHLESLGGFCFKVRYDYAGFTLMPGESVPNSSGNVSGLHYSDWSAWDRSNDWSASGLGANFVTTVRIPVYDRWGNLIGGQEPPVTTVPGTPSSPYSPQIKVPIIVKQPTDAKVQEGESVDFEVRATTDGDLTYQWRVNGVDLPGETSSVLHIDQARQGMSGNKYTVLVTGPHGFVVSQGAKLTVDLPPRNLEILVQPVVDTVHPGEQARFDIVASGVEPLRYQWFCGARPIAGSKGPALVLKDQTWADTSFRYWVRVTDALGRRIDSRKTRVVVRLPDQAILRIPLEGRFSTTAGIPADTAVDLQVRLFDAPVEGRMVWSEIHRGVPVVEGRWKIEFGQAEGGALLSQAVATHSSLHLELAVDASSPRVFSPRLPLTAVPFVARGGAPLAVGIGEPAMASNLPIGTLYLDQSTGRTWFHHQDAWRALDE